MRRCQGGGREKKGHGLENERRGMAVNGNGLDCTRRANKKKEGRARGAKREREREREERLEPQAITMCSGCFGLSVRPCARPYVCPLSALALQPSA